jgi:hypothetical protein
MDWVVRGTSTRVAAVTRQRVSKEESERHIHRLIEGANRAVELAVGRAILVVVGREENDCTTALGGLAVAHVSQLRVAFLLLAGHFSDDDASSSATAAQSRGKPPVITRPLLK